MAEKAAQPAVKRGRSPRSNTKRRQPAHLEISKRAYFIYLQEGRSDELENWLRAERELSAA
jgi:hypothetical protein